MRLVQLSLGESHRVLPLALGEAIRLLGYLVNREMWKRRTGWCFSTFLIYWGKVTWAVFMSVSHPKLSAATSPLDKISPTYWLLVKAIQEGSLVQRPMWNCSIGIDFRRISPSRQELL